LCDNCWWWCNAMGIRDILHLWLRFHKHKIILESVLFLPWMATSDDGQEVNANARAGDEENDGLAAIF
jgi:hypothetical protein